MATITRDMIKRAMRLIGVCDPDETPTDRQARDALTALNEMMHGWRSQAVDVAHSDLTLDDEVNLDPMYIGGCTALLAVWLSAEYPGSTLSPATVELANNGWAALQAGFYNRDKDFDLRADCGLISAGGRRYGPR